MNSAKLNIDGINFEIIENFGVYTYYKIINNQRFSPTNEELKLILNEINKLNNQKLSLEDIKKKLKEEIKNNHITTYEELENYLNTLGIIQNKDDLISYGKKLIDEKNLKFTPNEILCQEIIEEYKNAMSMEKMMLIDFKVVDATFEDKYMEVSVSTLKDSTRYDFPTKYVKFDDSSKKELIEAVLKEVILSSKLEFSKFKNVDDLINNRVNYFLKTVHNCFINVKNIETYYAKELEDLIKNLRTRFGDNNSDERIDEINDELAIEEQNEINNLTYEISGPKLVRKKEENKGFVNGFIVFIISEFIAGLIFLLQIALLN